MLTIGIDPGLGGGIALLDESGELVEVADTPTYRTGKGARQDMDGPGMVALIERLADWGEGTERVECWIELVASRPGQGVRSVFTFGAGWGRWLGICDALRLPLSTVTPLVWRASAQLPKGAAKGASVARAHQLWPDMIDHLPKAKDGRAEAALIARHGWLATTRKVPT